MLPTGKTDARAGYDDLVSLRADILRATRAMKSSATAGVLTGNMLVGYYNELVTFRDRLATIVAVPGLQSHIDGRGESVADVAAAIAGVRAAGAALLAALESGIVNDGTNYANWRLTNGRMVQITYTAGQAASLVTLLDDLLASVE